MCDDEKTMKRDSRGNLLWVVNCAAPPQNGYQFTGRNDSYNSLVQMPLSDGMTTDAEPNCGLVRTADSRVFPDVVKTTAALMKGIYDSFG